MFTRKDYLLFIISLILLLTGYLCMTFDSAENGFGMATLWVAPPLLLTGSFLPLIGIISYPAIAEMFSLQHFRSNRLKHLTGFVVFFISLTTYMVTLEPTASLWDCSEFIACAFKLQVPHTPGNPLLLLLGRVFAMLSFGDLTKVARNINAMSAIFSALTVYLAYYIIYYFGFRLNIKSSSASQIHLLSAALCGSLCIAFSDTFWFSAVEAETYGPACFFLVLIVALTLKGKNLNEPLRSRWMVLIFYVAGLSYCIHPMCILSLPVLPYAWYINSRNLSFKNMILPLIAGMMIVLMINRFISIGIFELAFSMDLFMVNSLHFPFYSGAIVLLLLISVAIIVLLKKYAAIRAYTWSVAFLLLGFTPYLLLFIRSSHNPPIDENNPENLSLIKAYMNRESYPSSPLLHGPYFDAQITEIDEKKKVYFMESSQYKVAGTMPEYHYDNSRSTFFPRLYSNDADHIESYKQWTGLKQNEKPRFVHNLKFMFDYQIGHMYLRYLLWNFAGRESDHQDSNWLKPWDHLHIMNAPQNENKARNQYWMIPLVIGLLGIIIQYQRDRKNFYATMIFFLVTGLVLAVYLNSYPVEPRERDYIYVGSYIAFSIWIGLGVLVIYNMLSAIRISFLITVFLSIGLPAWMWFENYDDHNRAGRTFQIDNARNLLNSCAENSILFTGGDNDTFPLWYLQEVEGHRTDVRVMVMSYLNTDWYVNQLRKAYYKSAPFALTLDENAYRQYGPNDILYIQETIKQGIDLKNYLQLLQDEYKALRMYTSSGEPYSILPSRILKLKIDVALNQNTLTGMSALDTLHSELVLRPTGNYIQKSTLAMLDILVTNNWTRPIYFNFTSLNTAGLELNSHVVQEGSVYRLSPVKKQNDDILVNTNLTYKNLVENSDYSNLSDSSLNFNYEDYQARIITPLQMSFNSLALALLNEGDKMQAEKVIVFAIQKLYLKHLTPSHPSLQAADILISLGKDDLAKSLCITLFDSYYDKIQSNLMAGNNIERLDRYLVEQSALMLDQMGERKYISMLNDPGLR